MTFSTINDFFVSGDDLAHSPSAKQGVSSADELRLRRYGATLIWQACHRLELPMCVYSTACVLLHRFYCKESLAEYDIRVMACALLWMSCKLEEVIDCDDPTRLRLRDVLVIFYDCICRGNGLQSGSMYLLNIYSTFYARFKDAVIKAERDMLRCFGFVMHVEHAVPFVLTLGAQLGMASNRDALQSAYNIASDSLRTTLCVRVKAECVACAALFLAAQRHALVLPEDWWEGCGVDWKSLEACCREINELYASDQDDDNSSKKNAENGEGHAAYVHLSPEFLTFDASNESEAIFTGSRETNET